MKTQTTKRKRGRPAGSGIPGAKTSRITLGSSHRKVLTTWQAANKLRSMSAALRDILDQLA